MTALAELMTAREFGLLVGGNCPVCGGGQGCPCTHCQSCGGPRPCGCGASSVLSPLPDDVVTEPAPWRRVAGFTFVGAWAFVVAFGLYLPGWLGSG